jgi:hypothetical protein
MPSATFGGRAVRGARPRSISGQGVPCPTKSGIADHRTVDGRAYRVGARHALPADSDGRSNGRANHTAPRTGDEQMHFHVSEGRRPCRRRESPGCSGIGAGSPPGRREPTTSRRPPTDPWRRCSRSEFEPRDARRAGHVVRRRHVRPAQDGDRPGRPFGDSRAPDRGSSTHEKGNRRRRRITTCNYTNCRKQWYNPLHPRSTVGLGAAYRRANAHYGRPRRRPNGIPSRSWSGRRQREWLSPIQ